MKIGRKKCIESVSKVEERGHVKQTLREVHTNRTGFVCNKAHKTFGGSKMATSSLGGFSFGPLTVLSLLVLLPQMYCAFLAVSYVKRFWGHSHSCGQVSWTEDALAVRKL